MRRLAYSGAMEKEKSGKEVNRAAPLPESVHQDLVTRAEDLAYQAFEDPTNEHIEWIYMRLVLNHLGGSGTDGAVTAH